ncbi:hypothetical protein ACGFZL_09790 [Streptomyces sp. NPDC048182]|uniref:hypothetical protein n=1 Tax=unclassified Streptomyces TaxID=2593676 RepID=UPI0033A88573
MTGPGLLAAAYVALLAGVEDAEDAVQIAEARVGTLLGRLDRAPDEDRQELARLFAEVAREDADPAHKAIASGLLARVSEERHEGGVDDEGAARGSADRS